MQNSDNLFLLQIHFKVKIRCTPYEALFGGKPRAGLASKNLGELEEGVLAGKKLLEVPAGGPRSLSTKTRRRRMQKR